MAKVLVFDKFIDPQSYPMSQFSLNQAVVFPTDDGCDVLLNIGLDEAKTIFTAENSYIIVTQGKSACRLHFFKGWTVYDVRALLVMYGYTAIFWKGPVEEVELV